MVNFNLRDGAVQRPAGRMIVRREVSKRSNDQRGALFVCSASRLMNDHLQFPVQVVGQNGRQDKYAVTGSAPGRIGT